MELVFLGTGTSVGVPVVGCECTVCTSEDERNRRTRSSVVVRTDSASVLIDTPPELRLQLLREDIRSVDFVLYTHAHADHIMGLDDLRPLCKANGGELPVYGNRDTVENLRRRFDYVFNPTPNDSWTPSLSLNALRNPETLEGVPVRPLPVRHGNLTIYGYRIGPLAYISDVSRIPQETMQLLDDLDVLVLDALRPEPHPTHFHLEQALETARRIDAGRTYFTHLTHEIDHATVERRLPESVSLAYDGLAVTVPEGSKLTDVA